MSVVRFHLWPPQSISYNPLNNKQHASTNTQGVRSKTGRHGHARCACGRGLLNTAPGFKKLLHAEKSHAVIGFAVCLTILALLIKQQIQQAYSKPNHSTPTKKPHHTDLAPGPLHDLADGPSITRSRSCPNLYKPQDEPQDGNDGQCITGSNSYTNPYKP